MFTLRPSTGSRMPSDLVLTVETWSGADEEAENKAPSGKELRYAAAVSNFGPPRGAARKTWALEKGRERRNLNNSTWCCADTAPRRLSLGIDKLAQRAFFVFAPTCANFCAAATMLFKALKQCRLLYRLRHFCATFAPNLRGAKSLAHAVHHFRLSITGNVANPQRLSTTIRKLKPKQGKGLTIQDDGKGSTKWVKSSSFSQSKRKGLVG